MKQGSQKEKYVLWSKWVFVAAYPSVLENSTLSVHELGLENGISKPEKLIEFHRCI